MVSKIIVVGQHNGRCGCGSVPRAKMLAGGTFTCFFYVSRTELLTKTATYQQFCEKLG